MEDMVNTARANANPAFWAGRRVLVTGHSGFKGAWLVQWLHQMGAQVAGISLPPATTPSLFELAQVEALCDSHCCDIRDAQQLARLVAQVQPEIVFHLAAQALVRASYEDPLGTFASNVMGTANLLEAVRRVDSVRTVVAITTDKVYENQGGVYPFRESDPLGGHDPYSASKAGSELVVASYRRSFLDDAGIGVASVRAGNVIGGGDWARDRLLPDAVRCWERGQVLHIRRPDAVRPWQHVLEPLHGYLVLAERLFSDQALAGAYNLGPDARSCVSVREVIKIASSAYGDGEVFFAGAEEGPHEAALLSLENAKARSVLGISPRWTLLQAVEHTMAWYQRQKRGQMAAESCQRDILAYINDCSEWRA